MRFFIQFVSVLLFAFFPVLAAALDTVVWKPTPDAEPVTTIGRVLVVAQDKSLLIQERNGAIHAVETEMLVKATRNALKFTPMTRDELAESYLAKLPQGFHAWKTNHFVLFYKTSKAYARWYGLLLERLYTAFEGFWTKHGLTLCEPEFPLFCVIFPNSEEYHAFADAQGEHVGKSVIAYYSFMTNRVICYDLSGQESEMADAGNVNFTSYTRQILQRPNAEKQVATVIHEATHQLAHNRGLAVRFGDVPLWYNEGIALYFESPNLRNEKGWSGIGRPNPFWLPYFKEYLSRRPEGQLELLLTNDQLFQTNNTVHDAYAEASTLAWFLLKTRPKQFVEYCRKMGEKKVLIWDSAEERIEEFEEVFGPVEKLEKEFVRFTKRVK